MEFWVGVILGWMIAWIICKWPKAKTRCPDCQKDVWSLWWHNIKLQHVR